MLHIDEQQGTLAFMSCELLSRIPFNPGTTASRMDLHNNRPVHSAIHDMESFFWVLLYLCLTRKGPGGARREEFSLGFVASDNAAHLRGIVYCLFDSDDESILTGNKLFLMENPKDLEGVLFPRFHPYFHPLKGLLSKWWRLLLVTYRFYDELAQATLHDMVLELLDKELENTAEWSWIGQAQKDGATLTKAEEQRRTASLARLDTPSDEPNATAPIDNGSSSVSSDPTSPERIRVSGVAPLPAPQGASASGSGHGVIQESPTAKRPRLERDQSLTEHQLVEEHGGDEEMGTEDERGPQFAPLPSQSAPNAPRPGYSDVFGPTS